MQWEALAAQHGFRWSTCGSDIDPEDEDLLYDGIHPAPGGYSLLFSCLRPEVDALLAAGDACADPAAAKPGNGSGTASVAEARAAAVPVPQRLLRRRG